MILGPYLLWCFVGACLYLISVKEDNDCALIFYGTVTTWLYKKTKMNIVGCVIVATLYYITFPVLFVCGKIGMLVYWLLHIGRKAGGKNDN